MAWNDLSERHAVVKRVIALKEQYPDVVKSNVGAPELMLSDRAIESAGENGEHCHMRKMLPLYVGEGGNFDKPFCCYGNEVDCTRCGAYGVFNSAFHREQSEPAPAPNS